MKPTDKLFYIRALVGFLTGIVSALLSRLEFPFFILSWVLAIAWAAAIYYTSYKVLRRIRPRGIRKRDAAVVGLDSYLFMWLFSWTFFYTVWGSWA